MQLTDTFTRVPCDDIQINRDVRQRREIFDAKGNFINSDGLLESITEHGVLSPILIHRDLTLVFGERRLTASKLAGHPDIPVRFVEDLSPTEAQILELEENLRRTDLPWRDEVRSVATLHDLYKQADPAWTIADTSRTINYTQTSEALRVARDLDSPRIASATSVRQAWNTLSRLDDRKAADALGEISDAGASLFAEARPAPELTLDALGQSITPSETKAVLAVLPPESVLNENFLTWAAAYDGPKFNFIHCDFPYGVELFGGQWSGKNSWQTYADTADIYWELIRALCTNLDRLMAPSAHLMFWCSADIRRQSATLDMFNELAPSLVFDQFPLVWHKTDNVGIAPDPQRGTRRVTETALYARREDRYVVKCVSNAYGAPTDKTWHPSTKPEPMLRHFFQMFIDEGSRVLDPTCGGGSALRAAESLGAKHVLGLEKDPEYFDAAQKALRQFRAMRRVG